MKNITLAIEDDILSKARVHAAREGTTVNGLVRTYLTNLVGGETERQRQARMKLVELAKRSTWDPGPDWKWNREEIYAERLSRHERPDLRGFAEGGDKGEARKGDDDHG